MDRRTEELSQAFAALGSPQRLQIIGLLVGDERPNCGEIARRLELTGPCVSYHLRALEAAGLIQRLRRGQQRCVLLTPELKRLVQPEVLRQLRGGGS